MSEIMNCMHMEEIGCPVVWIYPIMSFLLLILSKEVMPRAEQMSIFPFIFLMCKPVDSAVSEQINLTLLLLEAPSRLFRSSVIAKE